MTPTPAPDEPIDPAVRSLLWRLRARLVNPPEQSRAAADLDRLFAAAQEHAHGAEPAPEVVRIIPSVTDDDQWVAATATGTGAGATAVVDHGDGTPVPAGVTSIASRRYRLTTLVGRVAAAAMLVVAVGGGLASARDGNGLTIQALLGRGTSEPAEPGTLAGGSAGDVADEPEFDASELPEPRGVPLPGDDDGEVADDPDQGATPRDPRDGSGADGNASSDDDAVNDEGDADEPTESAEEADRTEDTGSDADEPADAPAEAPTDEVIAAPAPAEPPADEPVDEVAGDPVNEVIGTGGPTPCREDEDLASCFDRRTAEEEAAEEEAAEDEAAQDEATDEADAPAADDPGDELVDDAVEPTEPATGSVDEDAAAKDELAKRRGS